MHMYVHMYMYTYMYIYMHTNMHMYTHFTPFSKLVSWISPSPHPLFLYLSHDSMRMCSCVVP
jgi:hypothetical protein